MATLPYKIITAQRVPPNTTMYVRYNAGSWVEVDVPEALNWPDDEGSATDLIKIIEDLINAVPSVSNFLLSIDNTTGKVNFSHLEANVLDIWWTDPAVTNPNTSTWVRDKLRMGLAPGGSGLSLNNADGTVVGWRVIAGGWWPDRIYIDDLSRVETDAAQVVSDTGVVQTTFVNELHLHKFQLQTNRSFPRDGSYNEWHAVKSLLEEIRTGRPIRYYPDRTNSNAYADVTEPFGVSEWVIDRKDADLDMDPAHGNWYAYFHKELLFRKYVSL
jgi:hypothetical protein